MTDIPIVNLALYAQTDVGMVRSGNEDNFLVLDLSTGKSWTASEEEPQDLLTFQQGYYGSLIAVSDGMGGALAGEVASRMAVETVRDRMLQLQAHGFYSKVPFHERLRLAVEEANSLINQESVTNPEHKGLGATFTAVAVQGDRVHFAQVGDSRAYLLRQNRIARVTKDQSLVQQLIDAGQITEEEAETHSYRNVILQALGAHSGVNVEVNALQLRLLDTLLLCSDGLSGKMGAEEMAGIVNAAPDLKTACQELIALANERGGDDNITVVIVQFSGAGITPPDDGEIKPESVPRDPETPASLDLDKSSATQPLNADPDPSASPPGDTASFRSTQQIKPPFPPPSQPLSSSSKPSRTGRVDNVRPGDTSDRRGPVTSVFMAEDVEAETPVTSAVSQTAPAEAELRRASAPTAGDSNVVLTESPDGRGPSGGGGKRDLRQTTARPGQGSRLALLIVGGLLLLGAIGVSWWYLWQVRTVRQAETQRQEDERQQQRLEARIGGLRNRVAELSRRTLKILEKPTAREEGQRLEESLKEINQRLDEVRTFPQSRLSEAFQVCNEIDDRLGKIAASLKQIEDLSSLPSNRATKEQLIIAVCI